jgi:hypothetical protein
MTENLAIWEQVSRTDPAFTKGFSRGGGFKGTSTNATYLARRATETFGPCGIGWGVKVLDERILDGAGDDRVHRVHIELWYRWKGEVGAIQHFGQTMLTGKNKYGAYTDEEAPKKSLTDAMTKALSLLGFAADVHLGLYDDNNYVAELKAEFADAHPNGAEPSAGPSAYAARKNGEWKPIRDGIWACGTSKALLEWIDKADFRKVPQHWVDQAQEEWGKCLAERLAEECHTPAETKAWAVEFGKQLESLASAWLPVARAVCAEHLQALRAPLSLRRLHNEPAYVLMRWTGAGFEPLPRDRSACLAQYEADRVYRMTEHQERSAESHNHEFAEVDEAWKNLPDHLRDEFPSPTHSDDTPYAVRGFAATGSWSSPPERRH